MSSACSHHMLMVPRLQQVFYLSRTRLEKCTVVDHVSTLSQLILLRTNALSVDVICLFTSHVDSSKAATGVLLVPHATREVQAAVDQVIRVYPTCMVQLITDFGLNL